MQLQVHYLAERLSVAGLVAANDRTGGKAGADAPCRSIREGDPAHADAPATLVTVVLCGKMMDRLPADPSDRLKSGVAVTAIHALLAYALLHGLGAPVQRALPDVTRLIRVTLEEPPPPPQTPAPADTEKAAVAKPKNPEGAASPANRKNTPTEIVAPPSELPPPLPPPIAAAPIAGAGTAAQAGAAVLPGPGTGAGGVGVGLGSGRYGDGTGGGGGGIGVRARLLRGGIGPEHYPRGAVERRAQGTTYIRFTVLPNGRVRNCVVTRSSGHRDLDAATCPLLERNLRYRPARDAGGRAISETISGRQDWQLGPEPPVREYEGELVED